MDLLKQIVMELLNNIDVFDLEKLSTETQTPLIDLLKYKDSSLGISDTFIKKFQNSFHDVKKMEIVLKQPTENAKIAFIKTLSNFNMKNACNNINVPKGQSSPPIKKEVVSMFLTIDKIIYFMMKDKENTSYRPEPNLN